MSSVAELMVGYVTIAAEGSQLAKDLGKAFTSAEAGAAKTGRAIGKAIVDGANPGIDQLQENVVRAEKRMEVETTRSSTKIENSKRKVEIAQAKLNETVGRYGEKSSQALTAVDRLSLAEQKLEAETIAAAAAQGRLQTELDQSKKALAEAQAASQTSARNFASGWRGVGQRIAAYATGGVKQAGDRAAAQASAEGHRTGGLFSEAFKTGVAALAAGVGVAAIGRGIWDSIQNAGDLEQSSGAVDSVFKKSAGQIHAWAVSAKTDVGVSQNAFNELASLIGSQLKNAGTPMDQLAKKTRELIGTGADLSSMFGGTTKEALEAVSAAFRGEMDPIERYGISLNQATLEATALSAGLLKPVQDSVKVEAAVGRLELAQRKYNAAVRKSGTDSDQALAAKNSLASAEAAYKKATAGSIPELDSQTKAMAVQLAIAKQSADAKGNFAREEDTFSHKQQVAAASWEDVSVKIGQRFLPVATAAMDFIGSKAIPAVDGFVYGLTQVGQWVQQNTTWLGPLSVAVGVFATALAALSIINSVRAWWAALSVTFNMSGIGLVITAVAALVAGLVWFFTQTDLGKQIVANAWAWIQGAIANVVSWWNGTLIPALQAVGRWFSDVWSGAVSVVQSAATWIGRAAQDIGQWFSTYVVQPLTAGAQAVGAAVMWLSTTIFRPVFGFIGDLLRVWWQLVSGIFLLVGAFIQQYVAPAISALWTMYVQPIFGSIGSFIVSVWTDWLRPALDAMVWFFTKAIPDAANWLYTSAIQPAFTGIGSFVSGVWTGMLRPALDAMVWFFTKTIPDAANWLYTSAIQPIFTGIGNAVRWVWMSLIKPQFDAWVNFFTRVLPDAFRWFKSSIVDPIWNGISTTISSVWSNGIRPVFDILGSFVRDKVAPAFKTGVDAVKRAWDGLIEVAKAPVRFVVNTVINDGLIGAFNSVAGWLKMDNLKIQRVALPQGFATGGWTGPGSKFQPAGVVHADEFVFTKEQTRAAGVGNLYALAATLDRGYAKGGYVDPVRGGIHLTQGFHPGHNGIDIAAATGTPVYAVMTGRVNWAGPGVQLPGIWGGNEIHINDGAVEAQYAHLSQIGVQLGQMVRAGQQIGLSGATGIVSGPHLHLGMFNGGWPNAFNPMSVFSGKQADGGAFNPIAAIVDGLAGKVKEAFPAGGFFVDLVAGFAKKTLKDVSDAVGKMIMGNSDGAAAGKLYDTGGWLMPGTQLVTNATGRPEPVFTGQQWDNLQRIITTAESGQAPAGIGSGVHIGKIELPERATVDDLVDLLDFEIRRANA